VNIALHLAREAADHPSAPHLTFVGLSTAAPKLRAHGIRPLGFVDFVDARRDATALAEGRRLANAMHTSNLGISVEESIAYLGLSMAEFRERAGNDADDLVRRLGRAVWCPTEVLGRIIDRVRPDVVVTTNSPRAERAAHIASAARGIPSVRIEDLFGRTSVIKPIRDALGTDVATRLVGRLSPSVITVMNPLAKGVVLKFADEELVDASPTNVRVTGQPVLEGALERRATMHLANLPELRSANGLPREGPLLVWATDNLPPDRSIAPYLVQWANHPDSPHLCIKMHPGPSAQTRAFFSSLAGPKVTVIEQADILDLLLASSATLSHFSTVGLEAALVGRPLALLDLKPSRSLPAPYATVEHFYEGTIPFLRDIASAVIDSPEDIPRELDRLFEERSAKPMPSAYEVPRHGARRILDCAIALATGSSVTGAE